MSPSAGTMAEADTSSLGPLEDYFPRPEFRSGKPLYFIHVPKCAGTSMRLMIENPFPGERVFPCNNPLKRQAYPSFQSIRKFGISLEGSDVISGHFGSMVFHDLPEGTNRFTWLRPPLSRAISYFLFFHMDPAWASRTGNDRFPDRVHAGERLESVFMDWLREAGSLSACGHYVQEILGLDNLDSAAGEKEWAIAHGNRSPMEVMRELVRSCFFIGLLEDHERSIDGFSYLTGILPPRERQRRNIGPLAAKSSQMQLTEEEKAEIEQLLERDNRIYAEIQALYRRQMEELQPRLDALEGPPGQPIRERLRQRILRNAASRSRLTLGAWQVWDPVYGENLDSREFLEPNEGESEKWRWTSPNPDTYLYFTLPDRQTQEIIIQVHRATPPENVLALVLRIGGHEIPLSIVPRSDGGFELRGILGRGLFSQLPEICEFHLHTPQMLSEGAGNPSAGSRQLGIALQSITLQPLVN